MGKIWGKIFILVLEMATIKFLLKSNKNPASIYVRVRQGRAVDVYANTKLLIDPKDWNPKGKVRNAKNEDLKSLNSRLDTLSASITKALNEADEGQIIDIKFIKEILFPNSLEPQNSKSAPAFLVEYFDSYIEEIRDKIHLKKKGATESTAKKYHVIRGLLAGLQASRGRKISIAEVGPEFISQFEQYLSKQGYSNNTIGRSIKFIKTVCRHAHKNGVKTSERLTEVKGYFSRALNIHLDFNELDKISRIKLDKDYLDNARDWLIISCYTGQRVSDFMRFTKEMIRVEKGKHLIEFSQVKTDKKMVLPIHKKVLEVLNKRDGEFPRPLSDQKYNLYIKEVCKIAGINDKVEGAKMDPETKRKGAGIYEKWELVSSHIGRRSFSSNFYGSIPTALLIHATGHSTEKMFLDYVGKDDSHKAMQLAEYF